MKKIIEVLTPEQQEQLRNVYLISDSEMYPIVAENAPTADTLKVIAVNPDGEVCVYTAGDFRLDGANDFEYDKEDEDGCAPYVYREAIPQEVIDVLDAAIKVAHKK